MQRGNYGPLPECEVTESTPNTHFLAIVLEKLTIMLLEWRITNHIPGDPSVPSPGVINASTGVVNWTAGWWGTFDIEVRTISCFGSTGDWVSSTFTIGPIEDDFLEIFPETDLPLCPIPPGGLQTILSVPNFL